MRHSVYEHFKNSFSSSVGATVCVDEMMNVIACTESVYKLFNTTPELLKNINTVLSTHGLLIIEQAISNINYHYFSYTLPSSGKHYICTVTPMPYKNSYYFLISFIEINQDNSLDDGEFYTNLWHEVNTSKLNQAMNFLSSYVDISDGNKRSSAYYNLRKIRKIFSQLEVISGRCSVPEDSRTTELNSYIAHVSDAITHKLGKDRISFKISKASDYKISKISYAHLDMVFCNIVIMLLHDFGSQIEVDLSLFTVGNSNVILFSCETDRSYALSDLIGQTADGKNINSERVLTFAVISHIVMINGGELKISEPQDGKLSLSLIFPAAKYDKQVLYSPRVIEDTDDEMSVISVQLTEI